MCDAIYVQRRVCLERARKLLEKGASLDHVLGDVWNSAFVEGGRDREREVDEAFDRRLDEINRELIAEQEAIESGCVELGLY